MPGLALLVLRLTIATILIAHGAHILFGTFSSPNVGMGGLSAMAATLATAGVRPAFPLAVLTGVVHLAGGALIAIGFMTRAAAFLVAVLFGVQVWRVEWRWGFFMNWVLHPAQGHGIEFSLLLLGVLVCLVVGGAGEWSFDGRRAHSAAARASARARLRTRG
jgi:putative oxidoreductase